MKIWSILFCWILAACSILPSPAERHLQANALARQRDWTGTILRTGTFDLVSYLPRKPVPADRLTIYIEGDGLAWLSRSLPSSDPTPLDPVALRLALAQPQGNAAYLARPCQFLDAEVEASACTVAYWTDRRFSEEVVQAMNVAIDQLKREFDAHNISLVGYSGGGAIAALVAARRHDVDQLITVAGNLDHRTWTELHGVLPLLGSLNPAEMVGALQHVRQWHFIGGRDPVVPALIASSYVSRFPPEHRPTQIIQPDFDHRCCWVENWPALWRSVERR